MVLSIIFIGSPEIVLKSRNNSIDNIDNSNFLIKRLFNFPAVSSNSDRKGYVSEAAIGDLQLY